MSKVGLVGLGEVVESVVGGPVVTDIHPGDLGDSQLGYSLLSVHQSGVLGLFITFFWQSQTTKIWCIMPVKKYITRTGSGY